MNQIIILNKYINGIFKILYQLYIKYTIIKTIKIKWLIIICDHLPKSDK